MSLVLTSRHKRAIDQIESERVPFTCKTHSVPWPPTRPRPGAKVLNDLVTNGFFEVGPCYRSNGDHDGYALTDLAYEAKYGMTKSQLAAHSGNIVYTPGW